MTTLCEDEREIRSIEFPGQKGYYGISFAGVTKIIPYKEPGQMGYVAWFEVWKGDKLYARVNSLHIEAVYYEEGK